MPLAGLLLGRVRRRAEGSDRPGRLRSAPCRRATPIPSTTAQASVTALQSETTTHLTVADRFGNVVSYTFTIESTGGNGIVVPGWGFLLNNELTDFNFDSLTHPNRVEGGKRPRSSMSPTIVLDDGQPFLALGSPGGSTIITTVLQLLVDRLDLGATLPEAIAARATQRNTAATLAEAAFLSSPEAQELAASYRHVLSPTGETVRRRGSSFLAEAGLLAMAEPVRRAAAARRWCRGIGKQAACRVRNDWQPVPAAVLAAGTWRAARTSTATSRGEELVAGRVGDKWRRCGPLLRYLRVWTRPWRLLRSSSRHTRLPPGTSTRSSLGRPSRFFRWPKRSNDSTAPHR